MSASKPHEMLDLARLHANGIDDIKDYPLRDIIDGLLAEIDGLEEQYETLREAIASLEAEGWFASWSDDPHIQVIRMALNPARRPNPGEATDAGGYCGRHGGFTGRMCPGCAEDAASAPASRQDR